MEENGHAGCVRAGQKYRPLVIVTHRGVYFCDDTFFSMSTALDAADQSIEDGSYGEWHFHAL